MISSRALPDLLRPFATEQGAICVLALDHRDALRNAYARAGMPDVSERTMLDLKGRVVDALGPSATAVLVDAAALERCRMADVGVFMPLEEQGHDELDGGRLTRLLEDFDPAQAAALGAQGCKLLLYYRDDHAPTAERQFELTVRAAQSCHDHGLALVVEPKTYRLEHERPEQFGERFAEHVVAAAAVFAESGADLLKLQFPGDAATCRQVDAAAGAVPWTLLGGADVDGAGFVEQVRVAVEAGASGFIAGRPLWGGALALPPEQQARWLAEEARPRFEHLVKNVETHARRSW